MKIGIIGAGMIGGTLARCCVALGHEVSLANSRGPASLADIAKDTGARAATVEEAVKGQDLIVVTIPEKRVAALPQGLFAGVAADVPVIDTGNYYPRQRDGRIEPIEGGMTESRWVATTLGHAVVKAFNCIGFRSLGERGKPKGAPDRIALPIAGDDAAAKAKVMALIEALGFDAYDAGGLDDSWRQQPGQPCYVADSTLPQLKQRLADANPVRQPKFTGTAQSPGTFTDPR
jgi:predicted dinucleotide-binding enzyme